MVKNIWINPELKELSIENTLQPTPRRVGDFWECDLCKEVYHNSPPSVCTNKPWWKFGQECGSTKFTNKTEILGDIIEGIFGGSGAS